MTLVTALQLVLSMLIVIDAFGRLAIVNGRTAAPVRHAFALLFASALMMAGATATFVVPGAWPMVLMLLAILVVQRSTARYWRRGPPPVFQEPPQ